MRINKRRIRKYGGHFLFVQRIKRIKDDELKEGEYTFKVENGKYTFRYMRVKIRGNYEDQ